MRSLAVLSILSVICLTGASRGPQGVFQIRLKKFHNSRATDINNNCCQGLKRSGQCSGFCKTKFRVCLKHYQNTIDLNQGCTFGEEITPVLGSNDLLISRPPINFDINFKWPVSSQF